MKWILILAALIIIVGGALVFLPPKANAPTTPTDTASTTTPTPTPTTVGIPDLITIETPTIGQIVTSPLTATGKARGTWYFEASFPIGVLDAKGNIIGEGHGEAQGSWMTEDFVPFTASLTFAPQPAGTKGTVVFKNDNPSGDPAREKKIEVPVTF